MSAAKIILALSLALVLSFTLVGCGGELSQEEVDRIIDGVTTAQYDTVKMDIDMSMTTTVEGGDEPGEITTVADGTGVLDVVGREMQMTMNMTMDIPEQGEQEMATEIYLVGGWMYTGMDIPEMGERWMKIKVTEDMWQQQSQVDQQIELLKTAAEVNYLGSETVDGTDCYVFEVVPSMEALGELLSEQTSGMSAVDLGELDLADLFEEMTIKEWIAKDNYRVLKTEIDMVMEMLPEDVGATEADFDKMTMDINEVVRLYDYNQPVSIDLPPAALNAVEMPY